MNWEMFDEDEVFKFLDYLRESGDVNVFGYYSLLMLEFGMTYVEAREWLTQWLGSSDQWDDDETKEEL